MIRWNLKGHDVHEEIIASLLFFSSDDYSRSIIKYWKVPDSPWVSPTPGKSSIINLAFFAT